MLDDLRRAAEVDLLGCEQADAAVPVPGVVPLEELPAEALRFIDAAEAAEPDLAGVASGTVRLHLSFCQRLVLWELWSGGFLGSSA